MLLIWQWICLYPVRPESTIRIILQPI